MAITALPTPPSRLDSPGDFSSKADALLGALPTLVSEMNVATADVTSKQATASTAATGAATQAGVATSAASTATTAANNAAASYDAFDDRYLGAKSTPPTLDNDGNALLVGALYYDSVGSKMYVWSGSTWGTTDTISPTLAGNLTFTGTANRITGDFSNATTANRVMFQTSTLNGQTSIGVLPNGTSSSANLNLFGGADPANASIGQIVNTGAEVRLSATTVGTGSYLPMTFYTGGAERLQIDASGNVGIGGANTSGQKLDIKGGSWNNNQNIGLTVATPSGANGWLCGVKLKSDGSGVPRLAFDYPKDSTFDNSEGLIIDITGNVLANSGTGGLGYGAGAGGTVTQATSKSTAVTLNKPVGQITMNAAALAANTAVSFTFNNSLLAANDMVYVQRSSGGSAGSYVCAMDGVGAGSCSITLRNMTAGSLSEVVVIGFAIIKGTTA